MLVFGGVVCQLLISYTQYQVAGEYSWVDGWPVWYTNWGQSEPSRGTGEGCVAVEFDGDWDDTDCSRKLMPLCKYSFGNDQCSMFSHFHF